MNIGKWLYDQMVGKGWTTVELAKSAGIPRHEVLAILRNVKAPTLDEMLRLTAALTSNLPVDF